VLDTMFRQGFMMTSRYTRSRVQTNSSRSQSHARYQQQKAKTETLGVRVDAPPVLGSVIRLKKADRGPCSKNPYLYTVAILDLGACDSCIRSNKW
jgi:hypothetical protein